MVTIDTQGSQWYRVFSTTSLDMVTQLQPRDDNLVPYSVQKTIYLKISARSQLDIDHSLSCGQVVYQLRLRNSQIGMDVIEEYSKMVVHDNSTIRVL